MTYVCARCGEPTSKGSLVVFNDGASALVALCPLHRNELRKQMVADGVMVRSASEALN